MHKGPRAGGRGPRGSQRSGARDQGSGIGTGNGAGYKIPVARHLSAVRDIVIFPKPAGLNPVPETEPGEKPPVVRLPTAVDLP